MFQVYLLLGANLGKRFEQMRLAFEEIEKILMSAFHGCTGLPERIDLPNVVNISAGAIYSPFIGTNIKEFHFAAKNEATIKELQFYKDTGGNLGVEGAVCVFDL